MTRRRTPETALTAEPPIGSAGIFRPTSGNGLNFKRPRGHPPDPALIERNARIVQLFSEGADVCDLAIQFELKPGPVANIIRAAGLSTRRKRRGRKPDLPPVRRRRHNPDLGSYPFGMAPPPNRRFCAQCDVLRGRPEVEACRSRWCSLKASHP